MGIERKEACLREIAAAVGKGGFEFEGDSRLSMDGGRSYIRSVAFDPDRNSLSYTLCDRDGKDLVSAYGTRRLEALSQEVLAKFRHVVLEAARTERRSRQQERAVADVVRKKGVPSIKL